jgi:hypothetical protein
VGGTKTNNENYTIHTFTSSSTLTVTLNAAGMPVNTSAPIISGTVSLGNTFTCTTGTWTGDPTITYAYQWKRNGTNISSATSSTYTIVSADIWSTITCAVTATNSVASVSATSNGILVSISSPITVDNQFGINTKLTPAVVNGGNVTVTESVSLNLTTATVTEISEVNNLTKLAAVIAKGPDIAVAEATSLSLTTATTRDITNVNDLTKLAATVATTYAVSDGVPVATGNNAGSGSGTTTTLSQLWYMG